MADIQDPPRFHGTHVLAELVSGDTELLDDEHFVRRAVHDAATGSGATVCAMNSHRFEPQGLTVLALLAESHLSVHTYPEMGAAFVDVFTCGPTADPGRALSLLTEAFAADIGWSRVVQRGIPVPVMRDGTSRNPKIEARRSRTTTYAVPGVTTGEPREGECGMNGWKLQEPVMSQLGPLESPVRVANEWEPLREVIVGTIDDMRVPEWDASARAVVPRHGRVSLAGWAGRRFPAELVDLARREVDGLATYLDAQGVTVRRPDPVDHHRPVVTPAFTVGGGFHSAMPRDSMFAVDDLILETPMAWRSRYFETFAFRTVLQDYSDRGARWSAAPKPQLTDGMWRDDRTEDLAEFDSVIGENEPLFDAADFVRIGDGVIVGQLSHVTNRAGVRWLQRHLGPGYQVLAYLFDDDGPMHIDTTLLPMGRSRVMVNAQWVSRLPDVFADWEVLVPPPSQLAAEHPLYYTSKWIHCNVLMLDEQHVLVEAEEQDFAAHLRKWGFEPIPLPFKHFQTFGGSFHCATLDVRRG